MKWFTSTTKFWYIPTIALLIALFLSGGCGPASPATDASGSEEEVVDGQTAAAPSPAVVPTATVEAVAPVERSTESDPDSSIETSTEEVGEPATTTAAPTVETTTGVDDPLPDEGVQELMDSLLDQDSSPDDTVQAIRDSGDERFVAVLLELMRARQIGISGGSYSAMIEALEELSGQEFGDDWFGWVEWYGQTELQPPPGFTGWKGQLLGRIDPGFADFLSEGLPSRIRAEEILWGGVPIDGIPPLEDAPMIPGVEAEYLLDEEPVFGVVVNGEARAYPLRIIDNHEMANDVIGGVPVSIAYCTLCGAAIAYDGRGPDDERITFGTSGFLYRSNKLMYDRPTRTLWNQLTGEPVLGKLANSGIKLDILPIVLTTWADWLEQHPDTLVLDRETGVYRGDFYEPGILYGDYFAAEETMFPVWQRSELLEDKEFVYTLYLDGVPKAYQVTALAAEEVLNDTVGSMPVVLIATRDTVTVDGLHRRTTPVTYTNGGEVRVFNRGEETFTAGANPDEVIDSAGRSWQVTEEALVGPEGERAPRINGHLAYWFGWYAFFPDTELYPAP